MTTRRPALLITVLSLLLPRDRPNTITGDTTRRERHGDYTFHTPDDVATWTLEATGEAAKRMPKPHILDGKLYCWRVGGNRPPPPPPRHPRCARPTTIDARWTPHHEHRYRRLRLRLARRRPLRRHADDPPAAAGS
jgi:hypothetical protein